MRLRTPSISIVNNSYQRPACKRFNINQLATAKFNKFQHALERGSGPGGRSFKSSLPRPNFSSNLHSILQSPVLTWVVSADEVFRLTPGCRSAPLLNVNVHGRSTAQSV